MGEYFDYSMKNAAGDVVTGICHKQGENNKIPSVWMPYVTIESLEKALEKALTMGGELIDGPKKIGNAQMAVIKDPSGAYITLYQE